MSANVFCITPSSFQKEMLMTSAAPLRFIYSVFFFSPFSPSFSPSLLVLCANAFERISVSCDNSRIWTGRLLPAIVSTGRLPLSVIKEKRVPIIVLKLTVALFIFLYELKNASHDALTRLGAANVVALTSFSSQRVLTRPTLTWLPVSRPSQVLLWKDVHYSHINRNTVSRAGVFLTNNMFGQRWHDFFFRDSNRLSSYCTCCCDVLINNKMHFPSFLFTSDWLPGHLCAVFSYLEYLN